MHLTCPCGEVIEGADEDAVVEASQKHLQDAHPGRSYTREQILFFVDD